MQLGNQCQTTLPMTTNEKAFTTNVTGLTFAILPVKSVEEGRVDQGAYIVLALVANLRQVSRRVTLRHNNPERG